MPRIAGPWLASTFDGDRAAARAAFEALNVVFTSPEKVLGVKKTFQRSILEYCRDVILRETIQTLSDERTVSSDDAKATYGRVVATALSTVRMLMVDLTPADRAKEVEIYEEILREPKLWSLVHNEDAGVRRAMDRLAQTCLQKQPELVEDHLKAISTAFIYHGLQSDQTSSALEFLQTLELLTAKYPAIWNGLYSGKKPAISRLRLFMKQGTQGAPSTFWQSLNKLLKSLPLDLFPIEEEDSSELLSALRTGVGRKEERFNASVAWPVYYTLVDLVISCINQEHGKTITQTSVLPIIKQYLHPSPETAEWAITSARASSLISQVVNIKYVQEIVGEEWPLQADQLIELARLSQPEQSKDFEKSQRHVASTAERFADLQRDMWSLNGSMADVFRANSLRVIKECIGLLESRNGKPYGAAAVIESLLRSCSRGLLQDTEIRTTYITFVRERLPAFISGPSKRQLMSGLYSLQNEPDFQTLVDTVLEEILQRDDTVEAKLDVLHAAFTPATPSQAVQVALTNVKLQDFIAHEVAAEKSSSSASLFANLAKAGAVSDHTVEKTLSDLTTSLSVHDSSQNSIAAIETLWDADETTVRKFMAGNASTADQLIPNVLKLEQSTDDAVADKAAALSIKLSSAIGGPGLARNRFSMITQNLETTSESSLSIDSLLEMADRLLGADRTVDDPAALLPSLETWTSALCVTMKPPKTSLALLSPLGGVTQLVHDGNRNELDISYDGDGLSQALRIAMFITKLLTSTDIAKGLGSRSASVHALLYATTMTADDNLSISGANGLWRMHDQDTEELVLEFISEASKIFSEYFKGLRPNLDQDSGGYMEFTSTLHGLKTDQDMFSSSSYYAGLSSAKAHDSLCEMHGSSSEQTQQAEKVVKERRSAKDPIGIAAAIAGFRQSLAGSQGLSRYCNELVADLTDLDIDANAQRGFEQLALFNVILTTQEDGIAVVAKQRRIFLVKRLLSWLQASPSLAAQAEICKALSPSFEGISDMYGEHWEQVISYLVGFWTYSANGSPIADSEDAVTMMNASLRLLQTLRRLSKSEEPNDDLSDALNEKQDAIHTALVALLLAACQANDERHQPLQLTHELLARQLSGIPYKSMKDVDELYPLLYAPSRAVMQAAFDLLHRQIPAAQEQISFDAALDNKTAQLPDELLSMLLEAPTLDSLADASFHRMMPQALQSYLYSWRVLFDHFEGSSYKVKNDYVEQLKDGSYLTNLLDLVFDFLGHTRGRPADTSRFDVQEYIPDTEPSPEKDVQWLLAHLYFLALTHLPSLVKSYYLDIRSRQTSQAIDTWTAKHISPLVIRSSLEAVDEWSKKSVNEDPEYEKMTVKVGMRSREINVSYVVDEQTMAIKVVLPEAYPLASAQVVGVSRVAVKEEKWQSWLRNCQGVITFSVSQCRFS